MTKLHPTLGVISDEMAADLAAEGDTSAVDVAQPDAAVEADAPVEAAEPADLAPAAPNAHVQGEETEWVAGDKIRFHDGLPQVMTDDEDDGA